MTASRTMATRGRRDLTTGTAPQLPATPGTGQGTDVVDNVTPAEAFPRLEQRARPTADEVAAALDTPVQVHGQQLSLAEDIERLEQQRNAAPPID
jgi:hypothetical protein